MPLHLSAFAFGLTVIAMLLDGQVFNALAYDESHDAGWWVEWWNHNQALLPAEIRGTELPDYTK